MDRFNIIKTNFEGVFIIEPTINSDNRGYFIKTFDQSEFENKNINLDFVQEDQSLSAKGVLRGMHFQIKHPQSKLLRVLRGRVFDVGVDLRKTSKTYGKWIGVELSDENHRQFFLPKGFAHGFLALEDDSIILYKVDEEYYPEDQGGLIYNDPDVNIKWPFNEVEDIQMKEKDRNWKTLKELGDLY